MPNSLWWKWCNGVGWQLLHWKKQIIKGILRKSCKPWQDLISSVWDSIYLFIYFTMSMLAPTKQSLLETIPPKFESCLWRREWNCLPTVLTSNHWNTYRISLSVLFRVERATKPHWWTCNKCWLKMPSGNSVWPNWWSAWKAGVTLLWQLFWALPRLQEDLLNEGTVKFATTHESVAK